MGDLPIENPMTNAFQEPDDFPRHFAYNVAFRKCLAKGLRQNLEESEPRKQACASAMMPKNCGHASAW